MPGGTCVYTSIRCRGGGFPCGHNQSTCHACQALQERLEAETGCSPQAGAEQRQRRASVQAYQCLAALEGTATLAQNTLDGIEALNQQELRKLSLYFDRVRRLLQHLHWHWQLHWHRLTARHKAYSGW